MKVFRKHNASTLFDAFLRKIESKYKDINGNSMFFYTWTQIEARAMVFDCENDANKALTEVTEDYTNNYSYTYSIV